MKKLWTIRIECKEYFDCNTCLKATVIERMKCVAENKYETRENNREMCNLKKFVTKVHNRFQFE